jgi:ATP-dependent Clp protease adaptor protein ClpS
MNTFAKIANTNQARDKFCKTRNLTRIRGEISRLLLYSWVSFRGDKMITFVYRNMAGTKHTFKEEVSVDVLESVETTDIMELIVYNDDFNTFDHVIKTLIRVCQHSIEQAEQCTWIIHYKGKCAVKQGDFDFLKPMRDAICEVGIEARIL